MGFIPVSAGCPLDLEMYGNFHTWQENTAGGGIYFDLSGISGTSGSAGAGVSLL